MNGKFYSPADQLCNEEARLSYAGVVFNHSDPSTPDTGNPPKRQRQFYEGEPDTTKWAVPPPPDIFPNDTTLHQPCPSNTDSNATEAKPPAAAPLDIPPADPGVSQTADAEPTDASQTSSPRLSNETMHQVRLLCSAQNDFERRLFEHRRGIQHEQEKIMRVIQARELVCPVPKKELEDTLRQHRADLDRADRRAIEKLDELRYQQQLKLESLGVPGFYPSSSIEVMQGQQRELRRLLGE
ncbi:hypothetical protein IWW39_002481 [Coemansia spiralis]|uniref:Uncharacterized protein n=1 Tax=Coemansia spiralis TaxID=417178 RepID=A0A9W8GMY7_9FUNG|nr:hypothetical protein IWW39_002481 [Coemansia spiralis]